MAPASSGDAAPTTTGESEPIKDQSAAPAAPVDTSAVTAESVKADNARLIEALADRDALIAQHAKALEEAIERHTAVDKERAQFASEINSLKAELATAKKHATEAGTAAADAEVRASRMAKQVNDLVAEVARLKQAVSDAHVAKQKPIQQPTIH